MSYAPQMGNYQYQDRGYEYDQGYSPYHDDGYQDQALDMPYGQHYGQQSYGQHQSYGHQSPYHQNRHGHSYDDLSLGRTDPYYADENNMQLQLARPHTPLQPLQHGYSQHSLYPTRHRRHSTVSYSALPPTYIDNGTFHPPSSLHIKFKRKNALLGGISLEDAQSTRTKLSGNDRYTMGDLHSEYRQIRLRVQWNGYAPLVYLVPLEYHRNHHRCIDMQVLGRRVARAVDHYLNTNGVPVPPHRVQLHHLEELVLYDSVSYSRVPLSLMTDENNDRTPTLDDFTTIHELVA
ncbi:hypothetical protein MIND_00722200 [Mycena indigotica]|uniref:DUF6741 domain-containing protein n=1 Tax=Mycena indigotica TaxID=2126181 RepID=A0A8H6SMJ3_9AGAR|nr:uncharacterized protein MIND_00722200 [Mycena indigotica]KAF7301567.1 hypothetical protein MIND_00722200 [Mycena indigotica]